MSAERLTFEPGRMGYSWRLATEHHLRYAFAAPLCRNRRVLDVACGEGYGSALLAGAGAAAVVGVDVAPEAIASATARFAAPGVRYLAGDATDLAGVLAGEAPFDAVVSFETIEHVADVDRFLEGIRAVLAPDGVVIISAPIEPGPDGWPSPNPFHRRRFTFDELKATTERHLGAARRWYVGTPLQGHIIAEAGAPVLLNDREDLALMMEAEPAPNAWLLPAVRGQQVGSASGSFLVGVWGADGSITMTACPQSAPSSNELWEALSWFKAENARLLRERDALSPLPVGGDADERPLIELVADLRRAAVLERSRLEDAVAAMADLRRSFEAVHAERTRLRQEALETQSTLRAALARQQELERERARLSAVVEGRAGAEAAMVRERELTEAVTRLAAHLDRQVGVEAALSADVQVLSARLQAIEASRSWRLVRAYARLLQSPVLGAPLRLARRLLSLDL